MLLVQAMLFVWVVSQSGRSLPGQSPGRLGLTVALDLTNVLEREPKVDLARYVQDQYAQYTHPFFVMTADGRVIMSGSHSFPEPLLRMARAQLRRVLERPEGRRSESGDRPDLFGRGGDRFERDPNGFRFLRPSPILVYGRVVGVVVVPPQAPFGFLLGRFAPMLALVAGGVLILGAVLTSAMIFGPARRRLRALETAAHRLGRLIGELLDLARLEGGGGALQIEDLPVARLFDRVTARHEHACRAAGVTMERSIEPGAETVAGDRNRLEQALQNLAANAIRYAPPGSTVRLRSQVASVDSSERLALDPHVTRSSGAHGFQPNGVGVTLSVEDEGAAGIAPEHLPHIFDRFYKADAARAAEASVAAGSGLGLSIVRAIVERHGGRISVTSRPGLTVFEMVLPKRALA